MDNFLTVTAGDALYLWATITPTSGSPDLTEATIFAGVKDPADNVQIPLTLQTLDALDNDLTNGLVIIRQMALAVEPDNQRLKADFESVLKARAA